MAEFQLPTSSIVQSASMATIDWFEYPVVVHPHHTDYAGVVWHGRYVQWLEEARIELLKSRGIEFAELVAIGCNLVVVDLTLRYHRPLKMGMKAIVKTRLAAIEGVKIPIEYEIQSDDVLILSARVTLVAVDLEKGRILRQLPQSVQNVLTKTPE